MDDEMTTSGISRRQLLERAGLGGLALAGGVIVPLSRSSNLEAADTGSPEAMLATAL
jgi:hypothetical protein